MPAVLEAPPPSVAVRSSQAASGAAPAASAGPSAAAASAMPPATPAGERPDPLATDVARAVRDLRIGAGLSERAAARLLGTSQTQLRRMEDPRYLPSLRSLARVAAAYGHRLRVLFEPRVAPGGSKAGAAGKPGRAVGPRKAPERRAPRRGRSKASARRGRGGRGA
jgi:transcriptional regulator with XRE-family HTH domain